LCQQQQEFRPISGSASMWEFMTSTQKGMAEDLATRKLPCRCVICRTRKSAVDWSVICPHLGITGGFSKHNVSLVRSFTRSEHDAKKARDKEARKTELSAKISMLKQSEAAVIQHPNMSPNPALALMAQHAPLEQQVALYHGCLNAAEEDHGFNVDKDMEEEIETEEIENYTP